MSRKYKFYNKSGLFFVSFATVYWIDIFTRQNYFNVITESITYCRLNKGMELWSEKVIKQKIDYIHNNPITAGFVSNVIDWKYSSARNFQENHNVLEIDETGFLA